MAVNLKRLAAALALILCGATISVRTHDDQDEKVL
jgi:hypothetical protein